MKRGSSIAWVAALLLAGLASGRAALPPEKSVLVLHSYHYGMRWANSVSRGIESVLGNAEKELCRIQFEFMDTKRIATDEYFEQLYRQYALKFRTNDFDIIISSDDDAFNFLLRYGSRLFGPTPIVFCGVNYLREDALAQYPNITGVVEYYDLRRTLDVALRLHPDTRRVAVVNDRTTTGRANHKRMDEVAPWYSNRVSIVYFEDMTIEEVEQNLSRLARGDLVLLLTFNRDKAGRVLRYRDAGTRICASSPVPVYGVWAFYLDDGIVGGMLTSGSTHGKTAAELALRVIGGEPPSAIPVVREGQNQYMFSFPAMERFGIRSSDLPPGSLVVNRPAKFYQVSRRVVWTLAGGTAVLAALGCLFAWAVYQKLRAQGALEAANRRLQGEIAERAKAEDRLRHEQRLFTGGPTVVFKWRNAEGWPVEYASPNVRSLLGYAPEDFTSGRVNYASLIHPEDLQRIKDEIREYADSGAPHFEQEYRLAGSDGPYRWVHDFTIVIRDERAEVTHYHGYVVDVTRRKQAEEERVRLEDGIRQAQKMESLGVLAGGIAHDFNNLLTGILGFTSLALETLSPSAPARAILLDIEKSARSAADLTRQLLAYSGKGKFVMQAVDLSELVREMARLLEITVSKKCVLRYQLTENLPLVEADATQLQQVMMNLIINASEAVKDSGGVIAVRTDAQVCDADHLATFFAREDLAPGAYACLEVADNGCGMSPEVQARMFEPFFSTKFTGRGLGLSAVLGIVRGHGGAIKVYSEAGQGTTVKMIFPASAAAQKLAAGRPEASPEFKGSGRILVVDDESTVRSVATQVLERTGFTVLAAASGVEAVRMFRARPADIRLVLLDLTMPGMGGEETMRQLRKIRPDVRVVLSSGFNEQEVIQRFIGENLAGFVQKPYTVQELRDAVRKALG